MTLVLQVTTGSRAGERVEFSRLAVSAGRHPESDLKFDPQRDLDVSTRHAEFRGNDNGWTVQDLGSTNGTWVNNQRITAATPIRAGDVVSLGANGPRLEVVTAGSSAATAAPRTEFRSANASPGAAAGPAAAARPKTEERIAIAVAKQTGSLKNFVIGLAVVVVVGIGGLVWMNQKSTNESRAAIDQLLRTGDSLRKALEKSLSEASKQAVGFDSVAQALRKERADLTEKLKQGGNVQQLTTQLGALDRRTNMALSLTNREVSDANSKAVAYIVVDTDHGAFSGTAFCILGTGLYVTNRHVVLDENGKPAKAIAIYLNETSTPLYAHLVSSATDADADVAFVQLDKPGTFAAVRGVSVGSDLGVGDPVSVIGYPGMTDLSKQGDPKKSTLTAGFVSKVSTSEIQINAFSAQGSSGSPVFDSRGYVIGVLNAGIGGTSSVISLVVPAALLAANIPAVAKGIIH